MLSCTISNHLNVVQNAHKANMKSFNMSFVNIAAVNATLTTFFCINFKTITKLHTIMLLIHVYSLLMRSLPIHTLFSLNLFLH